MKNILLMLLAVGATLYAQEVAATSSAATSTESAVVQPVEPTYSPIKIKSNAIKHKENWYVQIDKFGSSVDTGAVLNNGTELRVAFTMAPLANDNDWPYVEVLCALGGNLAGVDSLEISYESDKDILVKLLQTDMSEKGNETYAYYEMALPKSLWYRSVTVALNNFTQPVWSPEQTQKIPLVREHVTHIQIAPDIDPVVGGSASLRIKKVRIF